MHLNLQTRFIIIGLLATFSVAALHQVDGLAAREKEALVSLLRNIAMVTQRHMEGDMMHDAIRADVKAALVAHYESDATGLKNAQTDLAEHVANFQTNMEANLQERLPENIKEQLSRIHTPLEEYNATAQALIQQLRQGAYSADDLQHFDTAFSALEVALEGVSDSIAGWAEREERTVNALSEKYDRWAMVGSIVAVLMALFVPFYVWWGIFRPLASLIHAMKRLADNELDTVVPGVSRHDEIGVIANSVQVFKENAVQKVKLEEDQKRTLEKTALDRHQAMEELAATFESRVQGVIQTVASAATELYQTSESMSSIIGSASEKAAGVATASDGATRNVHSVASAVEEMSASVGEIAGQIARSTEVVKNAVQEVERADETSRHLEEATLKIGSVIELIQNIAGQINLLALNATIESARAGEAGRGFSVVANEVKNLAGQTTKATEEIATLVGSVQKVSKQVIDTLMSIKNTIGSVDQYASAISAAVEEQSATTSEIASNMATAASGTTQISNDIGDVRKASEEAKASASQVLDAARMLSKEAEKLSQEVAIFLTEIRHG